MICFIRYTSPGRLQNIIIDEVFWVIERICCEQIGCEMWLNYLLWLCRCQGGDNFTAMSKSHPTSQMLNPAQLGGIESSFVNFAFFIKSHMYNCTHRKSVDGVNDLLYMRNTFNKECQVQWSTNISWICFSLRKDYRTMLWCEEAHWWAPCRIGLDVLNECTETMLKTNSK